MTDTGKPPIQTVTLADIYYKQGFLEKARAVYEGILLDHPGHEKALARVAEINAVLAANDSGPVMDSESSSSSEPSLMLETLNNWLVAIAQRRGRV